MKYTIYAMLSFLFIILYACDNKQKLNPVSLEGTWFNKKSEKKAFLVKKDSMYFPGLKKGYPFRINADTLEIQFTNQVTKSTIVKYKSDELIIWDRSLSKDTITFERNTKYSNL